MILTPGTKLEAILAGAVSASQPEAHVDYVDYGQTGEPSVPLSNRTALNGASDVTILAACTAGQTKVREVIGASIYNKDSAAVTVTVKTDDGTTERIIVKATLAAAETLVYEKGDGWMI